MDINDYAWNEHERKLKEETEFKYSQPKIKITDYQELRNKIEVKLELLPQKLLAQWALELALPLLDNLDNDLKNDSRIELGINTLESRIAGKIRAYDLRQVGFTVNELAKESKTDTSKFAARCFAQAIATGHMRSHAMVSSDYAIKVVNILTNHSMEAVKIERERQYQLLTELLVS